jgi:prophage antirepressor-like protein
MTDHIIQPQTFNNHAFALRVLSVDGRPWFLARDLCDCLGLKGSPAQHLSALADHDRLLVKQRDRLDGRLLPPDLFNGAPCLTLLSDHGTASLVLGSKKPTAKDLGDWLAAEVFPALGLEVVAAEADQPDDLDSEDQALDGLDPLEQEDARQAQALARTDDLGDLQTALAVTAQKRAQELAALAVQIDQARTTLDGLLTLQAILRQELHRLSQAAVALVGPSAVQVAPVADHQPAQDQQGQPETVKPGPVVSLVRSEEVAPAPAKDQQEAPPWEVAA